MNTPNNIVIIGGGLAGAKTAEALREKGFGGSITLVAAENHLPYERPPLSKEYLAGKGAFEDAIVHPTSWYEEKNVTLKQGVRATKIDTDSHHIALDNDEVLDYDKLVLATGSAVRTLPLPGADAENVHYLRTVEDSDAIRATFGEDKKLVIIGGGWIGLEVASAARGSGTDVTVLEGAPLPLLRVLGEKSLRFSLTYMSPMELTCGPKQRSRKSSRPTAAQPACAWRTEQLSMPTRLSLELVLRR